MFDAFLSPEQIPFLVAAGVLVGLVAVTALGTLSGAMPALDHVDAHIDAEADTDAAHGLLHLGHHGGSGVGLGWLNVGRVPLLVLLMLLLGAFAVTGFAMVLIVRQFGLPAPWLVTVPAAAVLAVLVTRPATGVIGRLFPRDETYATGPEDWIGCTAEITMGPARVGVVAIGRLKDRFGNWHFPHVEPFRSGTEIAQGSIVLVVARRQGVLLVVPAEGRLAEQH